MAASSDFGRQLRRGVEQTANDGLKELAGKVQRELDRMSRTHKGRSEEAIVRDLRRLFTRHELKVSSSHLAAYAEVIASGGRVELRPQPMRLR